MGELNCCCGDQVARLPRTRSGNILRGIIEKIAARESRTMPATIWRFWMRSAAR
jgi:hypothetical protein